MAKRVVQPRWQSSWEYLYAVAAVESTGTSTLGARILEAIQLQASLGVKVIEAQRDADLDRTDTAAWADAVAVVGRSTGIKFLDIWNGSIRPALATLAMLIVVFEVAKSGFNLSDWDRELVGAILGIYVADRSLARRGK